MTTDKAYELPPLPTTGTGGWNVLKASAPPGPEQLDALEADGWSVRHLLPVNDYVLIYLKRAY